MLLKPRGNPHTTEILGSREKEQMRGQWRVDFLSHVSGTGALWGGRPNHTEGMIWGALKCSGAKTSSSRTVWVGQAAELMDALITGKGTAPSAGCVQPWEGLSAYWSLLPSKATAILEWKASLHGLGWAHHFSVTNEES